MKDTKVLQVTALIIGSALLSVNFLGTISISVGDFSPVDWRFEMTLPSAVYADEYDDLLKEKKDKMEEKEILQKEAEEANVKKKSFAEQLEYYQGELSNTQTSLSVKKALISQMEEERQEKEDIYEAKNLEKGVLMRDLYKRGSVTPLELFLGSGDFSSFAQAWYYYRQMVGEGRRQILEVSQLLEELKKTLALEEEIKAQLEQEASVLASQTGYYDDQIRQVTTYITDIQDQIGSIESEIADISAKQEELIREKLAATSVFTSVGEYEEAKQELPDPGFSPAFAVFSYGYPHRVGMSQYGAYGRSIAGQDYEEILKAYYDDIDIVEYDVPDEITVTGNFNDTIEFEDHYLKGIAEMPASWGDKGGYQALKAQAIAARTYAITYTDGGERPICDSQYCQAFNEGKAESDSAALWHEAVEETRGLVMVYDGSPIRAWYASTAGGYTRLPTDFDVKWNSSPPYIGRVIDLDGDGRAYDGPGYGDSPWFHKAWYAPSDGHPWLDEEDMLDLLNASQLSSDYNEYLSHPDNDGWENEEVLEALADEGISPLTDISEIKSVFSEDGYTKFLRVEHSGGYTDIDGQRFRKVFVLRSRGNLAVWSSLYDIVQR